MASASVKSVELVLLFVVAPLLLSFGVVPVQPFLVLWLAAGLAALVLTRDPTYDRRQLWNAAPLERWWPTIALRGVIVAVVLLGGTALLAREHLFLFVRTSPGRWLIVMVLYPVLSVYPQGVIYRALLLHRYRSIVRTTVGLVVLSAAAFGLMHVVFGNAIAPVLSFAAGLVLADTHVRSRSLAVSSVEHTVYGALVFTIGLGPYFYLGR